jgi:hypothetical protein
LEGATPKLRGRGPMVFTQVYSTSSKVTLNNTIPVKANLSSEFSESPNVKKKRVINSDNYLNSNNENHSQFNDI